ncbi:MAG TPA: response regulator [Vicinamibacteria bacterium]|nr:response regulator [Vicinamibacteria bacterium]
MKILIVDDEDDIRQIASLSLTRLGGMEVEEAATGAEAVTCAERTAPDLILLDVMMPAMDGPATLAALRGNPRTARIPVVFLTAASGADEVSRLKALGAAGVVPKPFDPIELPGLVRSVLARS